MWETVGAPRTSKAGGCGVRVEQDSFTKFCHTPRCSAGRGSKKLLVVEILVVVGWLQQMILEVLSSFMIL